MLQGGDSYSSGYMQSASQILLGGNQARTFLEQLRMSGVDNYAE